MIMLFLPPGTSTQEFFSIESGFCHVAQTGLELQLTAASTSWARDPPISASQSAGITGVSHHTQPIFLETGFHYVGQAGLELLASGSSCLGLPVRHMPPHPANFIYIMLIVPLGWSQTPGFKQSARL
uniref:Uncharacterized protein n=1 Tax=Macaca fascicularis TaxID=9541 RepID=A0A7N9CH49_MACFA